MDYGHPAPFTVNEVGDALLLPYVPVKPKFTELPGAIVAL